MWSEIKSADQLCYYNEVVVKTIVLREFGIQPPYNTCGKNTSNKEVVVYTIV